MEKFIVLGGRALKGEIETRGSKNAATPLLAACLLTEETCEIDNLPLIEDVFRIIEILQSLGAETEWMGERKLRVRAKDIDPEKIDQEKICQLRSSILILGALVARFGNFKFAHPGGCLIGSRPLETHFEALKELGVSIEEKENFYFVRKDWLKVEKNKKIVLREFSVTATENVLLATSLFPGKISLRIAAAEPHVQELCFFLEKMGVKIKDIGSHSLEIEGKEKLDGAKHTVIPDPTESGTLAIAAAATRGKVKIKNFRADHAELVLEKLKEMGVNFSLGEDFLEINPSVRFRPAKIQTLPYPGIPTDLQAPLAVLCTQGEGASLIHDAMYENRFKYLNELEKMGAAVKILNPHEALISGPTPLYGKQIKSFDLRAGATLIIAALMAQGRSEISDIYQVDRGYEKIEERLSALGADIKRVKE